MIKNPTELVVPVGYLKPFALNQIELAYKQLKQPERALQIFQEALAEPSFEKHHIFNNIGSIYFEKGQYALALKNYKAALKGGNTGDPSARGFILNSVGLVHLKMSNYSQAWQVYQEALALFNKSSDRPGERNTLSNIAALLEQQNQPELAIAFYKQSINITEAIRQDLKALPREVQQSYTETVTDTYRHLADLLLKQDRVLEAQRLLDLLKVQELQDYLRNVRGNEQTVQGIELLSQEQEIFKKYAALQNQKIQLNEFLENADLVALVQQLQRKAKEQRLDFAEFDILKDSLRQLQQQSAVLYPLVLEDRLELVLVTADSPPIRRTVPVKREDLNRAILEFRDALTVPSKRIN